MSNNDLFVIKDDFGEYVDRDSIWYNPEIKEWQYDSYKKLSACVRLHKSVEAAEKVIENLKFNLKKIERYKDMSFTIHAV